MILVGENLNVMSSVLGPAIKNREVKPVQEMAIKEKERGMDYIDINMGPARKQGPETMQWLVKTVQEVADLPLFLDTTNIEAIEAGLKVHKGKAIINSISCKPEVMNALLPLAKKYNAGFVGLLLGSEGIPRDANERAALAVELTTRAAESGIPSEDIWIDPIVLPVSSQQDQVRGCTEFMTMFKDILPGCRATCGLSNVSNGAPSELRPILNRTYLMILEKYGMSSAIVDAFDKELIQIAKGGYPPKVGGENLKKLVWDVVDGKEPVSKGGNLSEEEINYLKTTKVLLGHSLYSHSWLKL
ncbi:dihydropteroate synthase [Candidatus Desantisbacteria bacterium CG_4_10_14_0_8_um_filter_39_17]|uniref:Dihydropteroate synthase n=1 Tax=Candidatus Desantisbacteria bacterium CG_4_10_14_0_8_um_filter_39_17 TaxID=1974542 RepID=A0A2H9PA68_9BACT|nr:MAG: dihydropteroate synthase [Candidatus Desantisbacteria bacterium CG_4_10_14_0_8_um_filter_39_17]